MESQKYLENLIEECKVFNTKSLEDQKEYLEIFPNTTEESDVRKSIMGMSDENLLKYFKASQGQLDNQTMFMKIASFIYFCKQINLELDLDRLSEVEGLINFISVYQPFSTEYIVEENTLKEKNISKTNSKFKEFKNSLNKAINMAINE